MNGLLSASRRRVLPTITISISSRSPSRPFASAAVAQCVAVRLSGLLATFARAPSPTVPSTTASVFVYPQSIELAWQPSWRLLVTLHKGPASVLQVVSRVGPKSLIQ